jgi:hypothetical protein
VNATFWSSETGLGGGESEAGRLSCLHAGVREVKQRLFLRCPEAAAANAMDPRIVSVSFSDRDGLKQSAWIFSPPGAVRVMHDHTVKSHIWKNCSQAQTAGMKTHRSTIKILQSIPSLKRLH